MLFVALAAAAVPDLALLAKLGLTREGAHWSYARIHPSGGATAVRTLSQDEQRKVRAFLSQLPERSPDAALLAPVLKELERQKVAFVLQHKWIEDDEPVRLSALGYNAVVGILLGDPFGTTQAQAAIAIPTVVDAKKIGTRIEGLTGLPSFDGADERTAARVGPRLELSWGTPPRAISHYRNMNSLVGLYGHGSDAVIHGAFDDPEGGGATAARAAKIPLDFAVAWAAAHFEHEAGHFEHAYMGGARHVRMAKEEGYALGQMVLVEDWERLSPVERLRFHSGGMIATGAATDELTRSWLSESSAHWTLLPQRLMQKLDAINYGLGAPVPSHAERGDHANDVVAYSNLYGQLAGKSPDRVRKQFLYGAIWQAVDPLNAMALYSYLTDYVGGGKERVPNPMVRVGDAEFMAGTSFWPSEVGPQFGLNLYARDPKSGTLGRLSPGVGDDGQFSLSAGLANLAVGESLRLRAELHVWYQRRQPEPGDKQLGGAASVGADCKIGDSLRLSADIGVKSEGAMLGQGFEEGPFVAGGLSWDF